SSSNSLVSHQLGGLADPFNKDKSTLPAHLGMFQNGISSGLLDPLGNGLTSTTLAGSRIGTADSRSTEVDISNAFVSLGTLGGLAYLVLVVLALQAALRYAVHRRDPVSLSILGTLIVIFGQWMNGGMYSVAPLVWLSIGFVVRDNPWARHG